MLHRTRRHWRWLATLCLAFGATAGSAASDPMPPGYRPVMSTGGMSPGAAIATRSHATTRTVVARRGQTVAQVLAAAGVERRELEPAVSALASLLPPRAALPAGHELTLRQAADDDALLALTLQPQPGRTVTVTRTPTGWIAHESTAGQRRHLVLARGTIREDLLDDSAPPACRMPWPGNWSKAWRMKSISSASSAPGTASQYCLNASATARATCCAKAACCMPDSPWPAATFRSGATTPNSVPTGSTTRAAACAAPSSAPRLTAPASPRASACGRIRCSAIPGSTGDRLRRAQRHSRPRGVGWGGGADRLAQRLWPRRHPAASGRPLHPLCASLGLRAGPQARRPGAPGGDDRQGRPHRRRDRQPPALRDRRGRPADRPQPRPHPPRRGAAGRGPGRLPGHPPGPVQVAHLQPMQEVAAAD